MHRHLLGFLFGVTLLLAAISSETAIAAAGSTKTVSMQVGGSSDAARMDVTVSYAMSELPRGTAPGAAAGSDTFSQVTMTAAADGTLLSFSGGTLASGAFDNFRMKSSESFVRDKPAITRVQFFDETGTEIPDSRLTYAPGAEEKKMRSGLMHFTITEQYEFGDLNDGKVRLDNGPAALNIRYTLTGVEAFKDLPLSNFEFATIDDTSAGVPVSVPSTVVIEPGGSFYHSLGPVTPNTYAILKAQTMQVEDLDTGATTLFSGNLLYAGVVVPEPATVMLALIIVAGLYALHRRPRYLRRESGIRFVWQGAE